ncbi:MAG: hypothetical protein ABIT05_04555 [Chitinophagaceae bacterium]
MNYLQKLETSVLQTMLTAYSSYYGRILTANEAINCDVTIGQLLKEIASREKPEIKIPAAHIFKTAAMFSLRNK